MTMQWQRVRERAWRACVRAVHDGFNWGEDYPNSYNSLARTKLQAKAVLETLLEAWSKVEVEAARAA